MTASRREARLRRRFGRDDGSPADARADARKIERAAYRWNTASGMIMAFQSVIMLVVITRACDIYTAGVFTIAYANASLFLYVGKYGMRHYQVSDRDDTFAFADYRASRVVTDLAMAVTAALYLLYASNANGYAPGKTLVMGAMVAFKLVDCSEDVFMARYQQLGRLDVGARVLTVRLVTTIALFAALVALMADLLGALVAATAYTAVFYVLEVAYVKRRYDMPGPSRRYDTRSVLRLLKTCFPLFASSFLLFYIGNAPKYAIDALMDDAAQAYYGYIAMPVFIVTLLAGFVYNPMIASLADQWRAGEVRAFAARFAKLGAVIVAITAACDLAAWIAGVPVLDLLYNADTAPYLAELVILVTGGGFLAITTLAVLGITIIRFQRVLAPMYAAASIAAFLMANWAVAGWGIEGAAWSYFASMVVLSVLFVVCFAVGMRIQRGA